MAVKTTKKDTNRWVQTGAGIKVIKPAKPNGTKKAK